MQSNYAVRRPVMSHYVAENLTFYTHTDTHTHIQSIKPNMETACCLRSNKHVSCIHCVVQTYLTCRSIKKEPCKTYKSTEDCIRPYRTAQDQTGPYSTLETKQES